MLVMLNYYLFIGVFYVVFISGGKDVNVVDRRYLFVDIYCCGLVVY